MTPEFAPVTLPNRKALVGFILSILTLLSFCASFAPVPFSAIICYPTSIILGILSLVLGLSSLRQLNHSGENGRTLALVAVWIGSITIVVTLCMLVVGILLFPYFSEFIQQFSNQISP